MNTLEVDITPEQEAVPQPIAVVRGQAFADLPKDLYIPPDAMEVILETFEGPLDLLLYLIKKQNLDILDIPIAEVTKQYMEYVDLMKELSLELAAEYLVMAALLAEIKSRMLLPRPPSLENTDEDPRAELIRRLQEYERIKHAAEKLHELPQEGRDFYIGQAKIEALPITRPQPTVSLQELMLAFAEVLQRAKLHASHAIYQEPLSVRERMTTILTTLQEKEFASFSSLFTPTEGRRGVVVTFLAMLELLKEHLIEFVQAEPFAPIYLKKAEPIKQTVSIDQEA
ncbi:MAG: ScpA family protein [Gammaproteobacteria bacterium]|nr:ScpA family protein [Gammaproteobacteria bacterium]